MKEIHPYLRERRHPSNYVSSRVRPVYKRQEGAVAVMFAGSLLLIIGFFGLALDFSRVYNRKVEMQGVADTVAIAAAKKLNGSASGISDALAAARDVVEQGNYRPKFNYNEPMVWNNAAIRFSRSSNGSTGWLDASEATASPDGVLYVRVDTNGLDPSYATVNTLFISVISSSRTLANVSHISVAGRGRLNVTPLAICALNPAPAAPRANPSGNTELVEYGFRRGVSYDLMNLNPNGTTPAHFLVDPVAPPGAGSSSTNFSLATIGPYVCTGTVALPRVSGVSVNVQSGFPHADLFNHLNSRFGLYNGACDPYASPPDTNVRQYTAATTTWTNPRPARQTALASTSGGMLRTIADLPPPNPQTPTEYGPLWANARAVPWSAAGQREPADGYPTFNATLAIWASLYSSGPGLTGYPTGANATPYSAGGSFSQLPPAANRPGIKKRRVLNIPLLQCPVPGSVATVLAIGRFFMTVQADANIISAEFAGAADDNQLGGPVELYK